MAVSMQDHIHLSQTLSDVTTPTTVGTWAITDWSPAVRATLTLKRSQTDALYYYVARNSVGTEVRQKRYNYRVKLRAEAGETQDQRIDRLFALYGKQCYLHDIYHDSGSHGTGYKTMVVSEIGDIEQLNHVLVEVYARISLEEI